jgi:hypothetical protein|tara:strand:- start:334 stop:540 length:207 start_codon:yes stop_codon:yes gene_type:complete
MAKTKITWTIKSKIISFLLTTQYRKEYDCMTPAQVAHKSATLIEKIFESDLPPVLALSNELQKTTKED